MSSKDLQQVTASVSDIGQPSPRRSLPSRRNHITQQVWITDQRTLYVSVHDDPSPAEIFLRVKGPDCTPETIALYDVIARLTSIALQYDASLERVGDLLTGAEFTSCRPGTGYDRLKHRLACLICG